MFQFLIFYFLFLGFSKESTRPSLIPYPQKITFQNESLLVDPFSIRFAFPTLNNSPPDYYYHILDFFLRKSFKCPRGIDESPLWEKLKNFRVMTEQNIHVLEIRIENIEENERFSPQKMNSSTNESYELNLTTKHWVLSANNYHSFLRGIETFFQLFSPIEDSFEYQIDFLPLHILDSPSLPYRGIMIDSARHFLPIETIKHVIDGMLFHKLNVLHWHISDAESFPLVLDSYPELAKFSSYSHKKKYTKKDVEDIINYANFRGVRVVPEIDSPGHSLSWAFSPNLSDIAMRCSKYNGQLDPTLNKTYDVVKGVLTDIQEYFSDEFVHLGGDEVSKNCWLNKTWIVDFMNFSNLSTVFDLQDYYAKRERTFLKPSKRAIYWSIDSVFHYNENDILQFWGESQYYFQIKNYTNPVILSPSNYLYLDVGCGNLYGDKSWSNFVTWKDIWQFNPYPPEIEKSRILGAEVTLWGELNSASTMDGRLWSRSSVFSERVWNPSVNNGIQDIVSRLVQNEERLIRRGFEPSPITSEYCGNNINVCFPTA